MATPEDEASTIGWQAIDRCLAPLYPGQEPRHWGTLLKYALGGPDPLDGISAYAAQEPAPHWHYVTYGFSELYAKQSDEPRISGWGFELTLRLARPAGATEPPTWPISLLQNLARYVFQSGNTFAAGDHMDLNGPISLSDPTRLVAFGVAEDPQLPAVETPNGRLQFLQIVGLTADEFAAAKRWNTDGVLGLVARVHPRHVMDLARGSILEDAAMRAEVEAGAARDGSTTGLLFNDATQWVAERRWLGRSRYVVRLGANPCREVAQVLPGRIPHGRALTLRSRVQAVDLEPGDEARCEGKDDRLRIALTPSLALALAERLGRGVGRYELDGLADVVFEVVPSVIRDTEGKVVREVR